MARVEEIVVRKFQMGAGGDWKKMFCVEVAYGVNPLLAQGSTSTRESIGVYPHKGSRSMWPKLDGSAMILPPKHARVFRAAASYLSDEIGWEDYADDWEQDGSVFDRLTPGQKQVVLLEIARALLDKRAETPDITAVRAAAVYEVYKTMQSMIDWELDEIQGTTARQMVLDAMDEANYWTEANERPVERPSSDCTDRSVWVELIESLCDEVLQERDFELERAFGDRDPEVAATVRRRFDIPDSYFTEVPEDPLAERLAEVRRELLSILRD